jgi:hypothetical protein
MTIIPLGEALLPRSCDLPEGCNAPSRYVSAEADSLPIWSCSVWGLPCPDHCCSGGALLPHLFTLIRQRRTVCFLWHWPSSSLDAGIPDVIRHTALRSSDFPPPPAERDEATVRSTQLALYVGFPRGVMPGPRLVFSSYILRFCDLAISRSAAPQTPKSRDPNPAAPGGPFQVSLKQIGRNSRTLS